MTPTHCGKYSDDDLIQLSGIQHYAFCPRQFALAYIELQWTENLFTTEGKHLHERVDDPFLKDSGSDLTVWRSVNLVSYRLGFSGRADVVEFRRCKSGISLPGKNGFWTPFPVEYKRGKPKPDERDEVQLCAQAICLEEMFETQVLEGALYYGEIRRRTVVPFPDRLRALVTNLAQEMHRLFDKAITPAPVFKPHCHSCSLFDVCLPKQMSNLKTVDNYLQTELS